ncbi:hypothetical protein [Oceanibium sediminis]|uniref:hypothetical protein n=1 Tax=Oceanibium sediminis TaxID=2026339 RepID=UPI0018E57420|nr:hypothetical protein [Oceanibium sediminis]
MRKNLASKPITLGEKLSKEPVLKPGLNPGAWVQRSLIKIFITSLLACISALSLLWLPGSPDWDRPEFVILLSAVFIFWWLVTATVLRNKKHFLLKDDRQGFMDGLRLDEKTAILDGSNIYHFGRKNGLDAQPLGEVAHRLRSQGYRIVCFFDANIFFTLVEHGAIRGEERHSLEIIEDIFGLEEDEIYVVRSGVQADKYILECLQYLPVSFAVTNDKFRDYAIQYQAVMEDSLWRKGVELSGGKVKLQKHQL